MLKVLMGGCLTLVLLVAGAGVYAWRWWQTEGKQAAVDLTQKMAHQAIDESQLTADEKKQLLARLDKSYADFRAGKLTTEDLERLGKALSGSKLLEAAGVEGWGRDALSKADALVKDPALRAKLEAALRRYARAVFQGGVDESTKTTIRQHITTTDKDGVETWRNDLSAKDLEQLLERLNQAADKAKIPKDAERVDYVGEFTKLFDKAMGQTSKP